ncbi:MAG TPA: DUF433 domain-containing protein [Vicinamibacteria bacterium]|nr:DUF433 domain-containing protein [Vicinamibacteria bacterium]
MATAARVIYAHIVKEPGYCGGKASIDNTRVRVNNVVWLHKEGLTPEQILQRYTHLSLAQVHAALAYYYDHVEEIEAELTAEEQAAADFEERKAGILDRRSHS